MNEKVNTLNGLSTSPSTFTPTLQFRSADAGKVVFLIKPDGSIELGEGATLDEASAAFWAYVERTRPQKPKSDLLDDLLSHAWDVKIKYDRTSTNTIRRIVLDARATTTCAPWLVDETRTAIEEFCRDAEEPK